MVLEVAPGSRWKRTVSVGVVCAPNGEATPETLLRNAYRALYTADRDGRNGGRLAV
ncbi:MAG: diguanylate cyclase [Acetobacteraceae bacterium]|nr:diguanylate cyclase [Acetobacteraceae bacterium]